jgi:hypothetical protein
MVAGPLAARGAGRDWPLPSPFEGAKLGSKPVGGIWRMSGGGDFNMTVEPKLSSAPSSAPVWGNWGGNIVHEPPANGANYYFRPTNPVELKSVLADAVTKGVTVRASGQRHSQPPLVTDDNRGAVPPLPTTYLVDMSCYADLGPGSKDAMVLGPGPNQVTVNPGVREDGLDAFLTQRNLMLDTVTAGGFFSIGGMTETIIDEQSTDGDGHSLLEFARVSLGALGIVTRMTLDVLPRPWANTLQGGTARYRLLTKSDFVAKFKELLTGPTKHSRVESFFTPYAAPFPPFANFLVLWWDVVANPNPQIPNSPLTPESACELSQQDEFGAPSIGIG